MGLKNLDGTEFRLTRPNPAMRSQDLWGDSGLFRLHNFAWDPIVLEKVRRRPDPEPEPEVEDEEPVFDEPDYGEPDPEPVPVPEPAPKPEPPKKSGAQVPDSVPRTAAWCLPARREEFVDPLYGDRQFRTLFGQKFMLEVLVARRGGFRIEAWTNVSAVGVGSILFLPLDRQWWQVEAVRPLGGGWILACDPSVDRPNFD